MMNHIHTHLIPKDDAANMKEGQDVEMHVKGKVKAMRPSADSDKMEVDMEAPESKVVPTLAENKMNAAKMPLKDLKKHVQGSSDKIEPHQEGYGGKDPMTWDE